MPDELRVLVVGQTPPPYHGQATMIQLLLSGSYCGMRLYHVRMRFSASIEQVGAIRARKIWHLVSLVASIVWCRVVNRIEVLYYPPSGPKRVPIARDVAVLLATRWMFRRTVFHFHASGIGDFLLRLNPIVRWLAMRALGQPDVAIALAPSAPRDGQVLRAKREMIIPNGVPDPFVRKLDHARTGDGSFHILFVGALLEEKGVLDVIRASLLLLERGRDVHTSFVGAWPDDHMRHVASELISRHDAWSHFSFPGVLTGKEKWDAFRLAHAFCFPSYYQSETFPLVLLEAMAASLPIVTTRWRAIPDVVDAGSNALLVPVQSPDDCARALSRLIDDEKLCARMGESSRLRYTNLFTVYEHRNRVEKALLLAGDRVA